MQNATIIRVNGTHHITVAPEEATVSVRASFDSDDREGALRATLEAAESVRAAFAAYESRGALTRFSSDQVYVSSHRPWNQDGDILPVRHNATVMFEGTFTDFRALSEFVVSVATLRGVKCDGVSWALSPQTHSRLELEVAQTAIQVAVTRAEAYARALGMATVRAVRIADEGLLSEPRMEMVHQMRGVASGAHDAAVLELSPEHIRVSTTVQAEFEAS